MRRIESSAGKDDFTALCFREVGHRLVRRSLALDRAGLIEMIPDRALHADRPRRILSRPLVEQHPENVCPRLDDEHVGILKARVQQKLAYAETAAFAGLAGLLQFSKLSVGDPTVAVGLELDVIAAVIIGGGSLLGGRGTVLGTLVGATIMTLIQIGCSQKGLPNWVQQIVTGGIIVAAVALDRVRTTRV